MKNLDILASVISKEKKNAPVEKPEFKLSDDDVNRIASKMVELMSSKTESVVEKSDSETEQKVESEKTESEGVEDGNESNDEMD